MLAIARFSKHVFMLACIAAISVATAGAQQTPDAAERLKHLRQAIAVNQKSIARYTWQQQETVSVNGDVKRQMLYHVGIGGNGKPVKVEISQSGSTSDRKHGIRHRISEDYANYAQQIGSLAQQYANLDPDRLKQLYASGQVSVRSGGGPGLVQFAVHGYVQPGDLMTITFNRTEPALISYHVATYLGEPSSAVTIQAQFSRLPDGTTYVSTLTVDGVSKNLTVVQTNSNFVLAQ